MRIVLVAAFALLSSTVLAAESKLSDPTDKTLAAKGCTYQKWALRAGQRTPLGEVHVDEGATGRQPGSFREWQCHNGQTYWKDTGQPWSSQK